MSETSWLAEGDRRLGARVRRAIIADDDSETVVGFADGTVVGWLPSHLSDFISEYTGKAAPLWHVKYDSQNMGEEDLEEVEVDDAAKAFSTKAWSNSEKSRQVREYREKLLNTLTQDADASESCRSAQTPTPSVSLRNASSVCSTRRKGPKFQAGERVECQFRDGEWYEAVVDELRADGSVLVTWDDDDSRDRIKSLSDLRKILPEELEEREGFEPHGAPDSGEGQQGAVEGIVGGCSTVGKERGGRRDDVIGAKENGGRPNSSLRSRVYNDAQKEILEAHFQVEKFVVKETAQELAGRIDGLNGGRAADWNCVSVWFMNRRKRERGGGGAESTARVVAKSDVGAVGAEEIAGNGGRKKLRARYLMQGQEAIGSQQELHDTDTGDDDEPGVYGVAEFMHKCWECRKGKYKGWKCSVRQCRSEIGSGVKGALGHTGPNWFDDEREKSLNDSERNEEMYAGKCAESSSDKEQDSADEMPPSTANGEVCAKETDYHGRAGALRSARLCKQQSMEVQEALAREQARADAAAAERDRLAESNKLLKASLHTAERHVARLLGQDLGILPTAELLNLRADHQKILGRVSDELLVRECEAEVIAKHPEFVCPLSGGGCESSRGGRALGFGPGGSRLMQDPVVAGDGHTYERANIERWFNQKGNHGRSPKTGERLSTQEVLPNRLAKAGIAQALEDARKRKFEAQSAPASVVANVQSHLQSPPAGSISAQYIKGKAAKDCDAPTRKRELDRQSMHEKVQDSDAEKDSRSKKSKSEQDMVCPHCSRSFMNVPSAQR